MAHAMGTSTTIGVGTGIVGLGRGGVATAVYEFFGLTQSGLAARIAPPAKAPRWWLTFLIGAGSILRILGVLYGVVIFIGIILGNIFGLASSPDPTSPRTHAGGMISACGMIYCCYTIGEWMRKVGLRQRVDADHYDGQIWPGLMHQWESSVICLRCGHVWIL
jgi:hypothetical protein